jgi:hypothetical protein
LIGHGFALLSTEGDISLTGVKAVDIAGERNDLDSVQEFIRGIIADDNGRTLFPDFSPD